MCTLNSFSFSSFLNTKKGTLRVFFVILMVYTRANNLLWYPIFTLVYRRKIVDHPTGFNYAREHDMNFFEVSAKTGSNIEPAFQWVVEQVLATKGSEINSFSQQELLEKTQEPVMKLDIKNKKKNNLNCCTVMWFSFS